ncbi:MULTISPECIES: DMT family transporter [Paenibacillus]|uniref:DMT family transporter n=1 Tax=Paenibacillus TaxID=44249 RepID=UPI0022B897DF|nr:DMT family transporter [Paenibacillus caseinilyticus]MCZ8522487.1 DMT family transporter [Paenibacillus caseinilyticus]
MVSQRPVYLLALLYALIIGFSFLFTKLALQVADPVDTLAIRFTIAFFAISVPVLAGWIKLRLSRSLWRLIPLGLLYPTAFFGFQAVGLTYTTSSEAAIFQATSPIFTLALASLLLRESTTWIQKAVVLFSVGGVIYIAVMSGASIESTNAWGMVWLLVSTVALSLYSVLARLHREGYTAFEMSYVMMLTGCFAFNTLAIVRHTLAGTMNTLLAPLEEPTFLLSILYIGLMSSMLSSVMSNYLLSRIEAYKMSLFVNLGTLLSVAAGVVFLREKLEYFHIVGAVLIIGGVLGVYSRPKKQVMEVESR